jgi:hypothetical protein
MSEKKDDLARIDEVEIQPLSDEDLESAAGGMAADSNSCPSDGCPTTFTCSCGCSSDV